MTDVRTSYNYIIFFSVSCFTFYSIMRDISVISEVISFHTESVATEKKSKFKSKE